MQTDTFEMDYKCYTLHLYNTKHAIVKLTNIYQLQNSSTLLTRVRARSERQTGRQTDFTNTMLESVKIQYLV